MSSTIIVWPAAVLLAQLEGLVDDLIGNGIAGENSDARLPVIAAGFLQRRPVAFVR